MRSIVGLGPVAWPLASPRSMGTDRVKRVGQGEQVADGELQMCRVSKCERLECRTTAKLGKRESGQSALCSWPAADRSPASGPGVRSMLAGRAREGAAGLRSGGGRGRVVQRRGPVDRPSRSRDWSGCRRGGSEAIASEAAGHNGIHVGSEETEKLGVQLNPSPWR